MRYDRPVTHPDDRIPLNPGARLEEGEDGFDEPDLGPDERDLDLMDGSWEERYYAGRVRHRDWNNIFLGLALLVLIGLVAVPLLVILR